MCGQQIGTCLYQLRDSRRKWRYRREGEGILFVRWDEFLLSFLRLHCSSVFVEEE